MNLLWVPIGCLALLSQGQRQLSCLPCFLSWEPDLATIRLGAPKIWPDRNVADTQLATRHGWTEMWACTPFTARVQPAVASSQRNCLSLSFFWLSLDLGKVVFPAPSLETPLASMALFSTARSIYCLSSLKPDKIFETIFKVALRSEVGQIKNRYSEPENFLLDYSPKLKWNHISRGKEKHSEVVRGFTKTFQRQTRLNLEHRNLLTSILVKIFSLM